MRNINMFRQYYSIISALEIKDKENFGNMHFFFSMVCFPRATKRFVLIFLREVSQLVFYFWEIEVTYANFTGLTFLQTYRWFQKSIQLCNRYSVKFCKLLIVKLLSDNWDFHVFFSSRLVTSCLSYLNYCMH